MAPQMARVQPATRSRCHQSILQNLQNRDCSRALASSIALVVHFESGALQIGAARLAPLTLRAEAGRTCRNASRLRLPTEFLHTQLRPPCSGLVSSSRASICHSLAVCAGAANLCVTCPSGWRDRPTAQHSSRKPAGSELSCAPVLLDQRPQNSARLLLKTTCVRQAPAITCCVLSAYADNLTVGTAHVVLEHSSSVMLAKARVYVGDEERRRKQRDLKRRYRERRKNDVQAMQQQVEQLEARYDALLNTQQQTAVTSRRAPSMLEQQYAAATNELNTLRRQIAVTKQKLAEFDGFASSLEVYLTDFDAPSAVTAASLASKSSLLMAPSLPGPASAAPHPRLTEQECQEMIKQCYHEIFDRRFRGQCLSSGMHMLGWEDQMFLDGTTLQFSMSKQLMGMSANELMQRTWDIVTTEEHMRTIQYSTLGVKVLHKINEDTLVLQRCVHHPQLKTVNWNNMVMFRLRSPRGYVVAYQTINHPAYAEGYTEYFTGHEDIVAEDLQPKFSRVNTLQWFLFEEDGDLDFDMDSGGSDLELLGSSDSEDSSSSMKREVLRKGRRGLQPQSNPQRPTGGVKVTMAGKVDNRDTSFARFYMFEVLTYIIRWENAVGSARLTF